MHRLRSQLIRIIICLMIEIFTYSLLFINHILDHLNIVTTTVEKERLAEMQSADLLDSVGNHSGTIPMELVGVV